MTMRKQRGVLLLLLLTACQSLPLGAPATTASQASPALIPTLLAVSTGLPTAGPTVEQLLEPYTIDGLRQHQFDDGPVTILPAAAKTDLYTRYLIRYRSDGLNITGTMQVPVAGHAPFPVIIMDHGYFNREEYVPGAGTDRAAEYLNRHGYLTLSSDYRSWGGSDIGPSLFYSGLAIDVINLVRGIPSIPQADATRVGMWGHSMGGGVTMKVLSVITGIKAAVLYSTVSADDTDVLGRWGLGCIGDIAAGEHQLDCNSSDVVPLDLPPDLIKAYYAGSTDSVVLRATSPIYHLDLVSAPVEINYGTKDGATRAGTPPEWSQKLYEAFKVAGKPATLYAYEGEFHSFSGDSWVAFMERSAHFFDVYVKGLGD
jgi:dipeptidyl aminopeptidase/acylaminoacyl peptidase